MSRKQFIKFLVHVIVMLVAMVFEPRALTSTVLIAIWSYLVEIAVNTSGLRAANTEVNTSNMETTITAKEFEEMSNKYEVRLNNIRRGL